MIEDKLKKIIFKSLFDELSGAEIIPYGDTIWFINRDTKFWYFEYQIVEMSLWWRFKFFTNFFMRFSLGEEEFKPLLCEWAENILNHEVISTGKIISYHDSWIDRILENVVLVSHPIAYIRLTSVISPILTNGENE